MISAFGDAMDSLVRSACISQALSPLAKQTSERRVSAFGWIRRPLVAQLNCEQYTKMAKDTASAARLLSALELLPLEKCTPDAAEWRRDIEDAIRELRGGGLPPDDPLRYDGSELVSEERLQRRLQIIIDSWPSWAQEKKHYGRKKHYSKNR